MHMCGSNSKECGGAELPEKYTSADGRSDCTSANLILIDIIPCCVFTIIELRSASCLRNPVPTLPPLVNQARSTSSERRLSGLPLPVGQQYSRGKKHKPPKQND